MMSMLGTVLTRLQVKATSLICNVTTLIRRTPLILIGALRTLMTRFAHQRLLLVLTESSISLWRVNLITVGLLIKAVLINVQAKAIQTGSLLLTIARQISQLVRQALLQTKDKLVGLIKSALLRLKEIGCALIPTDHQLTQTGTKQAEAVKPRRPRAKRVSKKGN